MNPFLIFVYAFIAAFIGSGIPGMLNMTAVSHCIQKGLPEGRKYAFGAALPFAIYAGVALVFAGFLTKHPELFDLIRQVSIFVFVVLAITFYWQATHPKPIKADKRKGAAIFRGFMLSCANALVIPYLFAVSSWLVSNGWMDLEKTSIIAFVFGAGLGALSIFLIYVHAAEVISRRAVFFTKHLNFFLAGLFVVLAVVQIGQLSF